MDGKYPAAFLLKSVKCPTLAMEGSLDYRSAVEPIVKGIEGARYAKCPGGVHDLQVSSAEWFNKVVQAFLLE